jgi:hypothetical protein
LTSVNSVRAIEQAATKPLPDHDDPCLTFTNLPISQSSVQLRQVVRTFDGRCQITATGL